MSEKLQVQTICPCAKIMINRRQCLWGSSVIRHRQILLGNFWATFSIVGKCFDFPSNFSLAKCQVLTHFAISNQTSNEKSCYKLDFHLVFGCSVVYLPYMDVSLVSCVNIPNIGQLPLLLKAKWRKPCKKGKTLLKLIARKNETEMTEPERASISREGQVARTSGKYNASKLSNLITKTSVQDRISSLRFCQRAAPMRCISRNCRCKEEHWTETCAVPKTLEWHRYC